MVVDVKLTREEGKPFGFRLIGGADFEIPLTCSKVVEGSTAEHCGLCEGDVVVRINNEPTINMTHEAAHQALLAAGSEFLLGVLRGTNVLPEADQVENISEEERLQKEQERIDQIISDKSVTDEEIAELLSGEAEVLKDHGVLGVNFNRMMPKAGVFKNSEVFQALNDEQLKTQEEREKEYRNWTSFLQKPSRPPPQRRTTDSPRNSYRPVIVRQPKPKCAPDYRTSTPEPPQSAQVQQSSSMQVIESNIEIVEEVKVDVVDVQREEECQQQPEQKEEQNISPCNCEMSQESAVPIGKCMCEIIREQEMQKQQQSLTFEELAAAATGEPVNGKLLDEELKTSEDEISIVSSAFTEQLVNVQKQLMALSHLPKTIQSTLDEITKQLQALIPSKQKSVEPEVNATAADDAAQAEASETQEQPNVDTTAEVEAEIVAEEISVQNEVKSDNDDKQEVSELEIHMSSDEIEEYEGAQEKFRTLWERKREKDVVKKDVKTELSVELKQKVTEDRSQKAKRAKQGFRGLQPQERPLILPGGRKWRSEKDAMNEEMIAEIISSQAELIMGSTLGVNFLKYQKPEKDLSFLKNSETYRAIHHMSTKENGIEKRPALVAAEEDVLKCASPHPFNHQ